jgi:hypothetical protein
MFYALPKSEREKLVEAIRKDLENDLTAGTHKLILKHFEDEDTYIRKSAYLSIGRIYLQVSSLQERIIVALERLISHEDFRVRQTVINAAGEIGKTDFNRVKSIFETGLSDTHHSPRNAVIGSIKKMGEVNPGPVLQWAKTYLHHPSAEIRREICHGIELRGRKHPEDILPMLQELEHDSIARVRTTLVHVIGQISYKKGCLPIVLKHLLSWKNRKLVDDALAEIIDVHDRYKDFAALTQKDAIALIDKTFTRKK